MSRVLAVTVGVAAAANPMRKGFVRMQRSENVAVAETTDEMRANAPSKLDWTTKGATTPVKDQGYCGSCWAYSATEGIESGLFMATGTLEELSEQQVISCDKTDGGCDGGDLPTAFAYVKKAGGIATESDYPDSSATSEKTGSCKWDKSEAASLTKSQFAIPECTGGSCKNQKESDLMAQLAANGPLSVCVNAEPWNSYTSGIMKATTCDGKYNDLDHCVQLVGYDNSVSTPYWKVRNSWGTSWGESGYIRLAMGSNTCGIADEAMFVTAALDAKAPVVAANPMRKGFVRQQRAENVAVAETTDEMRANAPGKLDWTTKGATTPVKDQGYCGSCWAYSATEGIESGLFMATGTLEELSEQQVISCDKTDGGCDGGDLPTAFAYVKKAGGIATESDYPDSSATSEKTGSCKWDKSEAASLTKSTFAIPECTGGSCKNQKESDLMAQLAANGPLSVCVNAEPWNSYTSGIMKAKTCDGKYNDLDHCVQLVGYDNTVSTPYWKVRNSWGTSWGEGGYIRLAMGSNVCGIADEAMYVTASLDAKDVVA